MTRTSSDLQMPEIDPEVFDRAAVSVLLTAGPDHRLVYRNAAFRRMFGPRRLGATLAEAFDEPEAAPFVEMVEEVHRSGESRQAASPRTTGSTAPGAPVRRHFVCSASPVVSPHGPGVLAIAVDTTSQVGAAHRSGEESAGRHRTLERYEALMSAVPQIIWLLKPDWTITELVGGFEELTGTPWRPALDTAWLATVHPRDRPALVRTWKEAAGGTPSLFVCTFRLRTAAGGYRHVQSRAVPVLRDGVAVEWVGSSADVEDQWRNRRRNRLLARVATVTAAHDVPQALAAVASAVVPELTDICAVYLLTSPEVTGDGPPPDITRAAVSARPGLPPLPPSRDNAGLVGPAARRVIDSGRPELLVFPAGRPPTDALEDVPAAWLRQARATSLTLVPIVIDSAVVALAVAAGCSNSPPPDRADLALLAEVLHEVREPLRRTMELQSTRHTALTLQRALLTPTPDVPGAELAARYQPASRTAEIGGDWYDALLLPDGSVDLAIGDIAGHDLDAATSMSQLRSMLRVIAYDRSRSATPAECLSQLDLVADGLAVAPLVTVVHVHLLPGPQGGWHASWSNAGHPPPLLVPATGPARYLEGDAQDLPLCVSPSRPRNTWHCDLEEGDTLILYTDGLVEVPGTDLAVGMAGLAAQAEQARTAGAPLSVMCAQLLAAVTERRDDTALIGFRPVGRGSSPG